MWTHAYPWFSDLPPERQNKDIVQLCKTFTTIPLAGFMMYAVVYILQDPYWIMSHTPYIEGIFAAYMAMSISDLCMRNKFEKGVFIVMLLESTYIVYIMEISPYNNISIVLSTGSAFNITLSRVMEYVEPFATVTPTKTWPARLAIVLCLIIDLSGAAVLGVEINRNIKEVGKLMSYLFIWSYVMIALVHVPSLYKFYKIAFPKGRVRFQTIGDSDISLE